MPSEEGEVFLTEGQLSHREGIGCRTLQRWRHTGDGPPYIRVGPRQIRYRLSAYVEWAKAREFRHRAHEVSRQLEEAGRREPQFSAPDPAASGRPRGRNDA
jgi:predicted DNA-binding transcriptional regulator AlpA